MKKNLEIDSYLEEFSKRGFVIDIDAVEEDVKDTAVMKQVHALLSFVDEKGLKLTTRGKLPTKVVQELVNIMPDIHTQKFMHISKRFIEDEQVASQRIRNVCQVAKLVRVKQGRLLRGGLYKSFMDASPADQFAYLYFVYGQLNFAYFDGHQDEALSTMIQYHFLQTIRDAEVMYRQTEVYVALFEHQHGWIREEIEAHIKPKHYRDQDIFDVFSNIVELRLIKHYFVLFGFLSEKELGEGFDKVYVTQKTPLLDSFLQAQKQIDTTVLLTPKKIKEYIEEATKQGINVEALQMDVAFLCIRCMDNSLYAEDIAIENIVKKYKVIGTKAEAYTTIFRTISYSIQESIKYFTRLEVQGGKEGDKDKFKQFIDALYLLLSIEKPRKVFNQLNANSFLLMEYLFMIFNLDSQDAAIEDRLKNLLNQEVNEDLNAYIYVLLNLDKKSKKLKRMNKAFEGLVKETLILMLIVIMSVRTFMEDNDATY